MCVSKIRKIKIKTNHIDHHSSIDIICTIYSTCNAIHLIVDSVALPKLCEFSKQCSPAACLDDCKSSLKVVSHREIDCGQLVKCTKKAPKFDDTCFELWKQKHSRAVLTLAFPLLRITIHTVFKRSFIMSITIIALWTCAHVYTIPHTCVEFYTCIVYIENYYCYLFATHTLTHIHTDPFLVIKSGVLQKAKEKERQRAQEREGETKTATFVLEFVRVCLCLHVYICAKTPTMPNTQHAHTDAHMCKRDKTTTKKRQTNQMNWNFMVHV